MKNCTCIVREWLRATPLLPLPALVIGLNLFSAPASSASASDTFKAKCAMCHGPDGAGATPIGKKLKLHDLRSSDVQNKTDDELAAAISKGKTPMPAFGGTLSSEDIRQLVAYLRTTATKN